MKEKFHFSALSAQRNKKRCRKTFKVGMKNHAKKFSCEQCKSHVMTKSPERLRRGHNENVCFLDGFQFFKKHQHAKKGISKTRFQCMRQCMVAQKTTTTPAPHCIMMAALKFPKIFRFSVVMFQVFGGVFSIVVAFDRTSNGHSDHFIQEFSLQTIASDSQASLVLNCMALSVKISPLLHCWLLSDIIKKQLLHQHCQFLDRLEQMHLKNPVDNPSC